jgi:methyl-accepting chemotaxis protein
MNFKSIQTKLTTTLLLFFIVAFSLLSAVGYYFTQDMVTAITQTAAKAIAVDYSQRLRSHIKEMVTQVESLASIQRIRTGENKEQIVQAMAELHQRAGVYDVIFFAWPDGSAVRWDGSEANYANRDYFQEVLKTKKSVVSDVVVSKTNGNMVISLAVPVIYNGKLNGVLAATYNLERLSEYLTFIKFEESGYGYLLDKNGLIISNPKQPEMAGVLNITEKTINEKLNTTNKEIDAKMLELYQASQASPTEPVFGNYEFVDGVLQSGAFSPVNLIGGQRWTLAVMAPEEEVMSGINLMAKSMLTISVAAILIALVFIMIISKNIAKPISQLAEVAQKLSRGDLSATIAVDRDDELGILQQALKKMIDYLRTLVKNIHNSSDHLAASSQELTASTDHSSQAADSVANNVMEVAEATQKQLAVINKAVTALGKLSKETEQATENAKTVSSTSEKTAQAAKTGVSAVGTAVNQMTSIQTTVETLAQEITILGVRSKEIGQIVETISGISGQTNLLALNAAIEAARAGEQGRGFAVVAEEVRKLAEQSQDAAKQISELIGAIQNDTAKAVQAMEAGTREVKTGSELVDNAGTAFLEIEELIARTTDEIKGFLESIHLIARDSQIVLDSSNEIYDLSHGISDQTQNVSAATQQQLASIQEIAASSQSLAKLAEELQTTVREFKL